MTEQGPEIIGREILRLDALSEREGHRMGKNRRADLTTRRNALCWALHVTLTGDPTRSPSAEVDVFLRALNAS